VAAGSEAGTSVGSGVVTGIRRVSVEGWVGWRAAARG
jgi:hypothetical protein